MFHIERFFTRLIHGYHKSDIWDLSETLRWDISNKVILYTTWQCEHGRYLPKEFHGDPAAWAEVLRKIELAWTRVRDNGIEGNEAQVEEGMALFGKYFNELHG